MLSSSSGDNLVQVYADVIGRGNCDIYIGAMPGF
jgi:hypothetical protein